MKRLLSLFLVVAVLASTAVTASFPVNAQQTAAGTPSTKAIAEDLTITGSDSLGNMLSKEFKEAIDTKIESSDVITNLEIDYCHAYVDLQVSTQAKLIVAIYDEDTNEQFCSNVVNVSPEDTQVSVLFDIDSLPEYYVVKAYMIDSKTKRPLCEQYICDTYSRAKQEFFAKTTADFDESRVLKLYEDNTNNFMVYNEDVVMADGDDSTNVITTFDEENQYYVIENIDETVSSLQAGDILTLDNNGSVLIANVSEITIDGTTAEIYGGEIELKDVFEYIKIDTQQYAEEDDVQSSDSQDAAKYEGGEYKEEAVIENIERIYLQPGDWNVDNAWFAAYFWESASGKDIWLAMSDPDEDGMHEAVVPDGNWDRVIFCRMNSASTDLSWENKWNQTQDLYYNRFNNCFVINDPWAEYNNGYWEYVEIEEESPVYSKGDITTIGAASDSATTSGPIINIDKPKEVYNHYFDLTCSYEGFSISGGLDLVVNAELKCYYDPEIFKKDELEFAYAVGFRGTLDADVSINIEKEINLCKVEADFGEIIEFVFDINLVIGGEVSAYLDGVITGKAGRAFKNGNFYDNSEKIRYSKQFTIEVDLSLGIRINPVISVGKIISVSVKSEYGIRIVAEMHSPHGSIERESDEVHQCSACLVGLMEGYHRSSMEITLFDNDNFMMDFDLADDTMNLGRFYFDVGKAVFSFGYCPNQFFKQTIIVVDENFNAINNVTVDDSRKSSRGETIMYLCGGDHDLTINRDGKKVTGTISVYGPAVQTCILGKDGSLKIYEVGNYDCAVVDYGQCGDNASWFLYENGVLVVTGTGSTYDYNIGYETPFFDHKDQINKIVIKDGITRVGECAFELLEGVESVTIGKNVEILAEGSFAWMGSLEELYVPGNVRYIAMGAFSYCRNLKTAVIGRGMTTEVGSQVFYHCDRLISVMFSDSVKSLGDDVFTSCTALETVYIGKGLKSIGFNTFYTTTSLKTINYAGTKEEWDSIDVGIYNGYWFKAELNTEYEYSVPEIRTVGDDSSYNVAETKAGFEVAPTGVSTKYFSKNNLMPDSQALLIVALKAEEDSFIDPKNIMYVDQTTVDSSGVASFTAYGDFTTFGWTAYIFGYCGHSKSYWEPIYKETEEQEGTEACICSLCGELVEVKAIPPIEKPTQPPTEEPDVPEGIAQIYFKSSSSYRYIPTVIIGDTEYEMTISGDAIGKNSSQTQSYYWYKVDVPVEQTLQTEIVFTNRLSMRAGLDVNIVERNKYFFGVDNLNNGSELVNLTDKDVYIRNFVKSAVHMIRNDVYDKGTATTSIGNVIYKLGDTDADNKISIMDATKIQLHLVEKEKLTGVTENLADFDLNTVVSILDATVIQIYLVNGQ